MDSIFLLTPEGITEQIEGCLTIPIDRLQSSATVLKSHSMPLHLTLIYQKPTVTAGYFALSDDLHCGR